MTAFRSFAPAAGVYGGAPRPRPGPWPAGAWPPAAGAAPGGCAPAVDGTPIVSAVANATVVQMRFRRKVMSISLCRPAGGGHPRQRVLRRISEALEISCGIRNGWLVPLYR